MPTDAKKPVPFFSTPAGTVTMAVMLWVLACVLAAVAILALNNIEFADGQTELLIRYAAFAPSTIAIVLSVVLLIVGSVRWALFGRSALPSVTLNLAREMATLESINQRLLLSETAKKITYRSEDLAVLRKTLQEDIQRGEYNAAMVLVTDLANTYGQLEESEQFREQIAEARQKDQDEKVAAGESRLENLLADHNFTGATKEVARLQRLYPDSPIVDELPHRITVAKDQYKHDLQLAFKSARDREEIDRALDIMAVLDKLLSHDEAEEFREDAREVIAKKRENLSMQFQLAVHDKEWTRAVMTAEQIIEQFPNTRMADELRGGTLDQLRANAGGKEHSVDVPAAVAEQAPKTPPPNTGISFTVTE